MPIRNPFAALFKNAPFRFPARTGSGYNYGAGWLAGSSYQPGSMRDWNKEAGRRFDNGVVMSCIKWKVDNFNAAPPILEYKNDEGKWERFDPDALTEEDVTKRRRLEQNRAWATLLLNLLHAPNSYYSGDQVRGTLLLSRDVAGQGYLYLRRSKYKLPVELEYIPHNRIWPVGTKDQLITGYIYLVDGNYIPLDAADVFRFCGNIIDPNNTRLTLEPLVGALKSVCTDNEIDNFQYAILNNGAIPGTIATPTQKDDMFTPDQAQTLTEKINKKLKGDGRGSTFVLSFPATLSKLSFSPAEMSVDKMRTNPTAVICSALGVDPMVIGLPSPNKTYANMEAAQKGVTENTLMPLWNSFYSQLSSCLLPSFLPESESISRWRIYCDLSAIPALRPNEDALHQRADAAWKAGRLTLNEVRAMTGFSPDANRDGYIWELVPGSIGTGAPGASEKPNKKPTPTEEDDNGAVEDSPDEEKD